MPAEKMAINFIDYGNPVIGSTRIYRDFLAKYLKKVGHDVAVNPGNKMTCDAVIFGKGATVKEIRKIASHRNRQYLVGKIHPTDIGKNSRQILNLCDFFITGSIEESDYYRSYSPNIFQFPQIEQIDIEPKRHRLTNEILLGYHGNRMHLKNAGFGFWRALEKLSMEKKIKLLAFYDKEQLGVIRTPFDVDVEHRQWDIKTIWRELQRCDIGVVPSTVTLPVVVEYLAKKCSFGKGYFSDYLLRFKNTTNSGRAFVFHQLGVPVIGGFSPSHFHIMGNPECGRLAHCEEGWFQALRELADSYQLRRTISEKARAAFYREYDPCIWAERLGRQMTELASRKCASSR